jgi:hypothetical protein
MLSVANDPFMLSVIMLIVMVPFCKADRFIALLKIIHNYETL